MDPIILKQREFYNQHKTLDINFRVNGKRQVICWIENHIKKIDNYIEN